MLAVIVRLVYSMVRSKQQIRFGGIDRQIDKRMDVFVLIENERQYTNKGCRVFAVVSTLYSAILSGWTKLVKNASEPHKIRFYKDRTGEFANLISTTDVSIEHWDASRGIHVGTYFVGWDGDREHAFDALLKRKHEHCDGLLVEWMDVLESGKVPEALSGLTSSSVHKHS